MDLVFDFLPIIILTAVTAVGMIFLKLGSKKVNLKKSIFTILNLKILLGGFLYFIASIYFVYLLKTRELSTLYPLTALTYLFVIMLSIMILKEKMNKEKWIGTSIIILGIIFMTV